MANVKISDLSAAATVDGTEVLPIVQAGATDKVTIANLVPGLTGIVSKLWTVSLAQAGEAGDKIVITATLKDLNNVTLAAATTIAFALVTAATNYTVTDEGSGTLLTTGANNISKFVTTAGGAAQIGITDTAAETIGLIFFTPQGPVPISLVFA